MNFINSLLFVSLFICMSSFCFPQKKNPAAEFCIISDVHYCDSSIGFSGSVFKKILGMDRKLLMESSAILDALTDSIISEKAKIVLVCGDMTKDGELINHKKVIEHFKKIEKAGKKVFVVPGNHDINNQYSRTYSGDSAYLTPNITPGQFKKLYSEFGYSEAIARDKNSLSYIVEPVKGLWIMALDGCRYNENKDTNVVAGRISKETRKWIKDNLIIAKKKNIIVFGMMHHNLLEHYSLQKVLFPEYIIEDNENLSSELDSLGMNIIFTGHYHCQDIVKKSNGDYFIFDVETGSSITNPCPYRLASLNPDLTLEIRSKTINNINYNLGGLDFQTYALKNTKERLLGLTKPFIMSKMKELSDDEADMLAPLLTDAMIAHQEGDEKPDNNVIESIQKVLSNPKTQVKVFGAALNSLWTDLPPRDNHIIIDLKNGSVINK